MRFNANEALWALVVAVVALGFCFTVLKGCSIANDSYRQEVKACADMGGSWTAASNARPSYSITCTQGRKP